MRSSGRYCREMEEKIEPKCGFSGSLGKGCCVCVCVCVSEGGSGVINSNNSFLKK